MFVVYRFGWVVVCLVWTGSCSFGLGCVCFGWCLVWLLWFIAIATLMCLFCCALFLVSSWFGVLNCD